MDSHREGADSDSDWDSTLDFTSPRQTGPFQTPNIQLTEDEDDFSRNDSKKTAVEKPKPKERLAVPISQQLQAPNVSDEDETSVRSNNLYSTPHKDKSRSNQASPIGSNQGTPQGSRSRLGEKDDDPPPYNFRGALNGALTPDKQRPTQQPSNNRRENVYDTVATDRAPSPMPTPSGKHPVAKATDSINSLGSWDDSDPDERTLRELRENFRQEKQKEQQADDLRLRLQREAELEKPDEGPATNRSETTWRSLGGGHRKGRKKDPVSSRSKPKQTESSVASAIREHRAVSKAETLHPSRDVLLTQVIEPKVTPTVSRIEVTSQEKELPTETPAYIDPPYIVKDEDGRSMFYFGHGSLQYYEVEDDASEAFMPRIADKVEMFVQRIYQEFFGLLRIATSVIILLIVELLKYIVKYIIQPLIVGILGVLGDYVAKPILSLTFNGLVHPFGVFMWNCFMTLQHMFNPISEILKKVFQQLAMLCRSIRCVEIHWKTNRPEQKITDLAQV